MSLTSKPESMSSLDYRSRTPGYYLSKISPDILHSLHPEQLAEFERVLHNAIPKPAPKIVDLRFVVDLIFSRFYVVLFIGKDRRTKKRRFIPDRITRVGNMVAVSIILISLNLTISILMVLVAYLIKSAMGINLFQDHFPNMIKHFFGAS